MSIRLPIPSELLERLLAGEFICPIIEPEWVKLLAEESHQQAINDYLQPLNRRLAKAQDSQVYFLSYRHFDDQAREHLQQQFSDTLHSLLPLLDWMSLVQETLGRDGALSAGDTIKLQTLILQTEEHPNLRQRLAALASDRFFNSTAEAVDAQLKQVFKRLKEHGYVRQPHAERQYFEVTGKVDYLIELVRFIRDEERLPVSESLPEQEALL